MRVLIVRLGAFGDIIHTLPLAADLHSLGHRVDWLCEERWRIIIDGSPAIDRVITTPRWRSKKKRPSLAQRLGVQRRIARALRADRYDAVIDAQGLAKSALWMAASGAPRRIGHQPPRAREGAWLLTRRRSPCHATHVIDQQRALALTLPGGSTIRGGWRFPLPPWIGERQWAKHWLRSQQLDHFDCLNVGAGWPSKVWPESHQREWCQRTVDAGRSVLLLWGSPAERELAQRLHTAVPATVLAPDTTIPQLAGLLTHAALMVSGDTGPLHLARALNTPAVGLFGPVPATRNGPRGAHWHCLQADGAAWERHDAARGGMEQLTVDAVLDASTAIRRVG